MTRGLVLEKRLSVSRTPCPNCTALKKMLLANVLPDQSAFGVGRHRGVDRVERVVVDLLVPGAVVELSALFTFQTML